MKPKAEIPFCDWSWCGHPQDGPGHPRKGSVQLKLAGDTVRVWVCSWRCAVRFAQRRAERELATPTTSPALTPEGRIEQLLAAGYSVRWIATQLGEPLHFVLGVLDRRRTATAEETP